jgi:hypothetical protein
MSTRQPSQLETALAGIPKPFRDRILATYLAVKKAFKEHKPEACGLGAGKFCEVVLRFLQHHLTGSHTAFGTKIVNFEVECQRLEQTPKTSGSESLRVILPRALAFLYTLRNKRGIGHVGGDIEANEIDSATISRLADWCLCELIRVFHSLPLEDGQALLDSLAERQISVVWSVAGKKRVLDGKLDFASKTLLLLYSETSQAIPESDLFSWLEHSHQAIYRRDVLRRLHKQRMLEFDEDLGMVMLSPAGAKRVEEEILPRVGS